MNRTTAIRYANEIARRVHAVNGVLATPLCGAEAVRIKRIWVFGSTVKGSQAPNDLDVLIDMEACGRYRTWQQTSLNKRRVRDHGIYLAPDAGQYALRWLSKGMKMVSRHLTTSEGGKFDVQVLIYPRMDLTDQEDYRVLPVKGNNANI